MGGKVPRQMVGLMAFTEALLHGWDLARASGQEVAYDDGVLERGSEAMGQIGEMGRQQGAFGPLVDLPGEATAPLDQVLAQAGRDPAGRRLSPQGVGGWSAASTGLPGPAARGPTRGAHTVSIDPTLLDDLEWRGLVAHSTDREALRQALVEDSVRFYVGFDPTAPSLHMGNLVQLLTARRLQLAGHTPYALVGGATGMIGDPRDSGERSLNDLDTVKSWVQKVHAQIEPYLDFEGANAATMVNNYDWTASLSTIDFLRDIGKHFPVNRMLARDVVRSRLEAGISYTEFSYVLLQSMDFLNLYRDHGVRLQFGGSDQWGNLTGGVELIRRSAGGQAHAFATPLVTKADGTKYGKTEGGALWLDPAMMSPYAFHQFWLNVEDEKVGELLRIFTFLSHEEIEALEAQTREQPYLRAGQKALADEVTTLVHGAEETEHAKAAASALFGGGDLSQLPRGDPGGRPARGRRHQGCARHRDRRPARRVRARAEQGRGAPHHRRGRRLPEQRAGHRRRAGAGGRRRAGRRLAGAAPGQEAPRRRGAGLIGAAARSRRAPDGGSSSLTCVNTRCDPGHADPICTASRRSLMFHLVATEWRDARPSSRAAGPRQQLSISPRPRWSVPSALRGDQDRCGEVRTGAGQGKRV